MSRIAQSKISRSFGSWARSRLGRYAALAALTLLAGAAHAQGTFNFSGIPGMGVEPSVQVNLNAAMLGFVAEAARARDPEAAQALGAIRGIQVLVYKLGESREPLSPPLVEFIDNASGLLERDGWQRAVYIQEERERVRVYMKFDQAQMAGLTVMVASATGDAVFVNVDGTIDPAMLGRIAGTLGMGELVAPLGSAAGAGGEQ
jgi:hypothetical protein